MALFPLRPLPNIQHHNSTMGVALPGKSLRLHPLQSNRHAETKNMAQMKELIKPPKIELSNEKIANLSDTEFKTLVIRMLTEMIKSDTQ